MSKESNNVIEKKRLYSSIGLILGFIAFALTVVTPYISEYTAPAKKKNTSVEQKIKSKVFSFLKTTKTGGESKAEHKVEDYIKIVSLIFGLLALGFGILGLILREDKLVAILSTVIGILVIIMTQYSSFFILAMLFSIIVISFFSQLGIF